MRTTFKEIRKHYPCTSGWKTLIDYYNPNSMDDKITIKDIIRSNGIKDAAWALRTIEDKNKIILFCANMAEGVVDIYNDKYPKDNRVSECIKGIRDFCEGKINEYELGEKRRNAYNAFVYAADHAIGDDKYCVYAAETAVMASTINGVCFEDTGSNTACSAYRAASVYIDRWEEIKNNLLNKQ